MNLSAFISEIPLIVISCRFGLLSVILSGYWESIRVSNTFDGIITRLNEFLDISRRDSISLLIRNVLIDVFFTSRRLNGRGPATANSSSMGSAVAAIPG